MPLTIFDLDHTLLNTNSSFRFGSFLYRQHFFSFSTLLGCLSDYARHQWLGMSIHHLHHKSFSRLFKGKSFSEVSRHLHPFLTQFLDDMLYEPVVQRLKAALKRGDHVVILSSSPDFLVREIANCLSVSHSKGTVYECDQEGQFIAVSHVMEGEEKAQYLKDLRNQMQIDASEVTVYSDSYLDLPMLKIAGRAVGVRPDLRLKSICLQNGWEIIG